MIKQAFQDIGRWLRYHLGDIISVIIMVVVCFASFGFGFFLCLSHTKDEILYWEAMTSAPEPEICSLCQNGEGTKRHAPCIINLSTGEIVELNVYEPHPTEIGEVSTELKTGYFSYSTSAGANIMRNQELEKCEATLPKDFKSINAAEYCYNCRRFLADIDREGYVLVDLYDPDNITVNKIWDGAKYVIRDYLVTAYKNENKNFVIEVHGLLNLADSDQGS